MVKADPSALPRVAPQPLFFATPADFRGWLEENHATARELWVGFYKKGSGQPSITWPESVDEALSVGWIDGLRKSIDEERYKIRFCPRKPTSNWSSVNIARVEELGRAGRMRPAGRRAFAHRSPAKSGVYSYEQRKEAKLDDAAQAKLETNGAAWSFFSAQPAWYRQVSIWWVMSAKREETRAGRLATLIEQSEQGRRLR